MTDFVEHFTYIAAVLFYFAAFVMAVVAFFHARLWARRVASVGIAATAAGWVYFYLAIANPTSAASDAVLWSRIFHYNTATWLFIMALVIRRSEKYGVELAMSRERHTDG